jgi:hypothetical protein
LVALSDAPDDPARRVAPGVPAERLAGDCDLTARTQRLAPDVVAAVKTFLTDEGKIAAIRERAREKTWMQAMA